VVCGIIGVPLNTRGDFGVVLKTGWEGLANLYHGKVNFGGTKRG